MWLFLSDLLNAIQTFLRSSWHFFTQIDVPGLGFSFAVLAVGVALIPISLAFLSLILGFPIGTVRDAESLGSRASRHTKISDSRSADVR